MLDGGNKLKNRTIIIVSLIILLITSIAISGEMIDHFLSGYVFEVLENDKTVDKKVVLRIDGLMNGEDKGTLEVDIVQP